MTEALRRAGYELQRSRIPALEKAGAVLIVAGAAASQVDLKKAADGFAEVFKGSGPGCMAGVDCTGGMYRGINNLMYGKDSSVQQGARTQDNSGEQPPPAQGNSGAQGDGGAQSSPGSNGGGDKPKPRQRQQKKDRSVEGTRVQRENIERAQRRHRQSGRPERIRSIEKSKQNEGQSLKKIRRLKDAEDDN